MGLLDSLLGQAGQNIDVAAIAEKFGIDPALATQAIAALGVAHSQPGDTVDTASDQTGIDTGTLSGIAQELGGSAGLDQLNQVMQDHPQILGMIGKFMGGEEGEEGGGLMGLAKGFFNKS
jgi:hypothetical protein